MRQSGILLHLTSLPGKGGHRHLGAEARQFVDFLEASGTAIWQVLPISPPALRSPPTSAFPPSPATPS